MDWWAAALSWEDQRVLRMLGVFLAVLGAVLVSPHGFRRMLYLTGQWALRVWWAIRGDKSSVRIYSANISTGALSARVVGHTDIPADAAVQEQVNLLIAAYTNLHGVVQRDYTELDGKIAELRSLLGSVDERVEEMLARMKEQQEQAVSLDAAGLPVIAWGIILSGVPQELAGSPDVGWFFIIVGILLAIAMARKTVLDGAWRKKGSEA
nr:hypothetical protein GCM10017547_38540 [Pseudarthrobacter oxydans]